MSVLPRATRRLLLAGLSVAGTTLALLTVTRVVLGWPTRLGAGLALAAVSVLAAGLACGSGRARRSADDLLIHTAAAAVAAAAGAVIFLVVVVGLGRLPEERERTLVVLAMVGTALGVLAFEPIRRRSTRRVRDRLAGGHEEGESVLDVFGQKIRRDIPLAEVLLQSAEALRRSMDLVAAEIWTGREGHLERTASVPERVPRSLSVDHETSRVAARAGVAGPAWLRVWLPDLAAAEPGHHLRAVPLGFGGDLLGLVVVERNDDRDFSGQEEEVLAELGRQMGLALHNTQLDLALQGTLDEVRRQAGEIQASRRRLVQAADGERRRIERDLHDGAQQHLVALSVNLRLARDMVGDAPEAAVEMLDQLHAMVKDTVAEVRNLAHGIYPPLLVGSGLAPALRAAATLSPLSVLVDTEVTERFRPEVEAAVYFCCLEALQNAAKHAPAAEVVVRLWEDAGGLLFEVADDGPGFDPAVGGDGHGFVNMADRLGAFGGTIRCDSAPGRGTRVSGAVPVSGISR
ncbi:MAG TPA: sensor histidine kinase [Acidimicrobiales bacterium]|nr:sensor histidine kinase [Acidimicrobiales bacterium]